MEKELRYLSFQGGDTKKDRLYDKQRQQLELREIFIRHIQSNTDDDIYIDPVLRHHLGLDPATPGKKDK